MDVVRLTKENTRLQSERDNAVQVRERPLAHTARLWQLVDRLGGDRAMRGSQGIGSGSRGMSSPRETQNVIPSPTSKGKRKNYRCNMHEVSAPPPPCPRSANMKTVVRSAAAVYVYACHDSWKGGLRQSGALVTGITPVVH